MNPTSEDILNLIKSNQLGRALRGEVCVFTTPSHVNDDMRPTDFCELLEKGLYPLVPQHGAEFIQSALEKAIREICVDALGVFCAYKCFYVEVLSEQAKESPIYIDRNILPKELANAFLRESSALHKLEIKKGDLQYDASYRVTLSGMRILEKDCEVNWGVELPKLETWSVAGSGLAFCIMHQAKII